jgi:hypothetical protein
MEERKSTSFWKDLSGKSTIAQMLTDGELNDHPKFPAGSGAKGETRQVQRCEGRGWYVTDTPGFGEPEGGAVPTTEAANRLKEFVTKISGTYSPFIYVLRKDRLTEYDASLWQFFKAGPSKPPKPISRSLLPIATRGFLNPMKIV